MKSLFGRRLAGCRELCRAPGGRSWTANATVRW
jgi:hypothetical protein